MNKFSIFIGEKYTRLYTVYEAPLAVISIPMSAYTKVRLYEGPLHLKNFFSLLMMLLLLGTIICPCQIFQASLIFVSSQLNLPHIPNLYTLDWHVQTYQGQMRYLIFAAASVTKKKRFVGWGPGVNI